MVKVARLSDDQINYHLDYTLSASHGKGKQDTALPVQIRNGAYKITLAGHADYAIYGGKAEVFSECVETFLKYEICNGTITLS